MDAGQFVLKPLGPELVEIDYAAYMSSIEHIRTTFSTSGSWPHEDISMADAMVDMQNEQRRFEARESFAYAVLTPDEQVELGCVYVYPSSKKGFDAVIRLWVTRTNLMQALTRRFTAGPPRGSRMHGPSLRPPIRAGRSLGRIGIG